MNTTLDRRAILNLYTPNISEWQFNYTYTYLMHFILWGQGSTKKLQIQAITAARLTLCPHKLGYFKLLLFLRSLTSHSHANVVSSDKQNVMETPARFSETMALQCCRVQMKLEFCLMTSTCTLFSHLVDIRLCTDLSFCRLSVISPPIVLAWSWQCIIVCLWVLMFIYYILFYYIILYCLIRRTENCL